MKIRNIFFIVTGALVALSATVFTLNSYWTQRKNLFRAVDEKLLVAVHLAEKTVPEHYHDKITGPDSVTPADYTGIVAQNNAWCRELNLQYLWSCLVVSNQIVFTSATSPSKDVRNQDHAVFFEVHQDPHAFDRVFATMRPDYSTFQNQWGCGRMLLVPGRDQLGRLYCFGASIETSAIEAELRQQGIKSILVGGLILLLGLAGSLILARLLTAPMQQLTRLAGHLAQGDLRQPVEIGGFAELKLLGKNLVESFRAAGERIAHLQRTLDEHELAAARVRDSEARLRHSAELQRSIQGVSNAIQRERNPQRLMTEACNVLVQTQGYVVVWIGQPEMESKRVIPVAYAGAVAGFLDHTTITWDESPTGRGPSGTAIRERRMVVVKDVNTDSNFALWRKETQVTGADAIVSMPMLHKQRLFGAITIKAGQHHVFDVEELGMLDKLAGNLAHALQDLEDQTIRQQLEAREHRRAQVLESLATSASLSEILELIVRDIEVENPDKLASILLAEPTGRHLLFGAAPSLPDFYNQITNGLPIADGVGSCGTAAFTRQRVIVEDIRTHKDPRFRQAAEQAGLQAAWSQPFFSSTGRLLGTFAVYQRRPHRPAADEIARVEAAAALASLAVERKQAQIAHEIAETRLHQALQAAKAGVWEWNVLTNENYWSDEIWSLYGLEPGSCVPSYEAWIRTIHPEDRANTDRAAHAILQKEKELNIEYRVQNSTGSERWLLSLGQPNHNANGKLLAYRGIILDITARKQAEKSIKEYNQQLVLTLEQMRGLQQQLIAQARMRALGQMASGIAHDFNNAVALVQLHTELLLRHATRRTDEAQLVADLKIILMAAQDAGQVVRRLREFYRVRTEGETLAPVKLNHVVQQTIEMTRPRWEQQAQAAGIIVHIVTDLADIPELVGDEAELREALVNLILNAIDSMPQGGTITIHTHADKEQIHLAVTDTGVGMTEEVREHCLEPFFTTKGEQGTGLGLSMVHGVATRHDGTVQIQTQPGHGTTATLHLPVANCAVSLVTVPDEAHTFQPLRILFVEDVPQLRKVLGEYLQLEGHRMTAAANGVEACQALQTSSFDVVITDRAMPGMSGDQLAAVVKKQWPQLPVIMITGFGDLMQARRETIPYVDIVLNKPVSLLVLHNTLVQLTKR